MLKRKRQLKHRSIRQHLQGTSKRPRVSVFRSAQHIYAQIIDDSKHTTLVSESDMKLKGTKSERARMVGTELAKKALKKNIKLVVFDRGGFLYHGRIEALAEGLREGGLEF